MAAAVPMLDAAGVQADLSEHIVSDSNAVFSSSGSQRTLTWRAAVTLTSALEKVLTLLDGSRSAESPYLKDNYAPVHEEVFEENLEILEGAIPEDLAGSFVRTGPNPAFEPTGRYHWFDGDGMCHAVRIKDGTASYCNHFVETAKLETERAAGKAIVGKIGDKKGISGLFHILLDAIKRYMGVVDASQGFGTANTALAFHANRLLALHEGDLPYALRIACNGLVETIGRVTFDNKVQHAFTAHPKIDPETQEMWAFGYNVEKAPYCWMMRCSPEGKLLADVPINLDQPVMMHDCALTQKHFIVVDAPLVFTPEAIVKKKTLPFTFDKTRALRIGVIDRYANEDSGIKWFNLDPAMCFHTANAWCSPDGNLIELYLCTFADFCLDNFTAAGPETEPHLTRVRLNMQTGEATSQLLCSLTGDFPTVPASMVSRETKYSYLAVFETSPFGSPLFYGISKVDLTAASSETAVVGTINHGKGRLGGEAYFVPRNEQQEQQHQSNSISKEEEEDAGYLITFVWDEGAKRSELVVYDALSMSSKPVVRIAMPQRVPFGFHCTWVTEEQMQAQNKV